MDKKLQILVSETIYKKYPFLEGIMPSIKEKSRVTEDGKKLITYQLIYQSEMVQENGRDFTQQIKVNVSEKGKILRISTSK